jgi:hypothetical protein
MGRFATQAMIAELAQGGTACSFFLVFVVWEHFELFVFAQKNFAQILTSRRRSDFSIRIAP